MLKQETRERLQALAHNSKFVGTVSVNDRKFLHASDNGKPTFYVDIDIHAEGCNIFILLAESFPDMKISEIKNYETEHPECFTFGNYAKGVIEGAGVNIWANHGQKEKPSIPMDIKDHFEDYAAQEEA